MFYLVYSSVIYRLKDMKTYKLIILVSVGITIVKIKIVFMLQYSDRMWPVIILGALMFIPGAYHMRVAILAYQKVPGYSFDDIPEFD